MKIEYTKNYLGIVIQNNDPLKRGRVKVWVPHIEMTVYEGLNNGQKNRQFNFPGINNFSGLDTNILEQLKMYLPWAEIAMPMVGSGNSQGIYNAALDRGTISDKSEYLSEGLDFIESKRNKETERAKKEIGEWKDIQKSDLNKLTRDKGLPKTKGNLYPTPEDDLNVLGTKPAKLYQDKPVVDAFSLSGDAQINRYTNPYSNMYRPMPYANSTAGSFSIPNVGAHVWVFFENGDPLKPVVFAVSYGKEDWKSIYDSHENDSSSQGYPPDYPGTFENGLNRQDKEYEASKDDMIYRSKYSLVQRGGAMTIVNTTDREVLNFTHFSGSYKEFNNYSNVEFAAHNDQRLVLNDAFYTVNGHRSEYVGGDYDLIIKGSYRVTFGDPKNHKAPLASIKKLMEDFHIKYNLPFEIQRSILDDYGGQSGNFTSCPTCTKAIYASLQNVADTVTQSVYLATCPQETQLNPVPKIYSLVNVPTPECMTCGGTGISPSTQDGSWARNDNKSSMTDALVELQSAMYEYEEQLGNTADAITNYGKNRHVVVGSEMHDFQSYRIDPLGKLSPAGVKLSQATAYQKLAATPLIEKVHVDAPPTGAYNMTCGYKYGLLAGSGGISFKTTGGIDIGGGIITIAGSQIVISSDNEVYIDGGKRTHLTGDNISLVPRNGQLYIGGNLEVDRNMVVRGGAHIEGELSVQHITGPIEYQSTETEVMAAHVIDHVQIGYIPSGTILGIDSMGYVITSIDDIPILGKSTEEPQVYTRPHYHLFKNIPLQLLETSNAVRADSMALNGTSPRLAKPAVFSSDMSKKFQGLDLNSLVANDPIQSTSNSDVSVDVTLSLGDVVAPPLVADSQIKENTCPSVHDVSQGLTPIV